LNGFVTAIGMDSYLSARIPDFAMKPNAVLRFFAGPKQRLFKK
jgi:hypothetical protein